MLGEHDQKGILLDPPCLLFWCAPRSHGPALAIARGDAQQWRPRSSARTWLSRTQQLQRPPGSRSSQAARHTLRRAGRRTQGLASSLRTRGGDRAPQRARFPRAQQLQCPSPGPLLLTSCTPQPAPCCVAHTKACPQPPRPRRPNQQCSVKAAIGPFRPSVIPVSPTRLNFAPHAHLSARFVHVGWSHCTSHCSSFPPGLGTWWRSHTPRRTRPQVEAARVPRVSHRGRSRKSVPCLRSSSARLWSSLGGRSTTWMATAGPPWTL